METMTNPPMPDVGAYQQLALTYHERAVRAEGALADLLGHAGDGELVRVITGAIEDAQCDGGVEYARRIGGRGRQTIAETILWRLREHARVVNRNDQSEARR